jgi:hypothetical protein
VSDLKTEALERAEDLHRLLWQHRGEDCWDQRIRILQAALLRARAEEADYFGFYFGLDHPDQRAAELRAAASELEGK